MAEQLEGKRVAALVTTGFEQVELLDPRSALTSAGATVHIVSPDARNVRGWNHTEGGDEVDMDRTVDQAPADDYDALLLPGGVMNPDLRNAGAPWVDREVVVDRGIVSTRRPSDIPAFNTKMIEEFEKGRDGSAGARILTHTHA